MSLRSLIIFLAFFFAWMNNSAQVISLPIKKDKLYFHHARHIDFIENKGQWEPQVVHRSKLHEADIWFEKDRVTFAMLDPTQLETFFKYKTMPYEQRINAPIPGPDIDAHAYQMIFIECNEQILVFGDDRLPQYENYYIGSNPDKWKSEVNLFHKITYHDLYQGVNLTFYEQDGMLKHDFIVAAGADPSQIKIQYEGIDGIDIENGQLVVKTSVNDVYHAQPFAYQIIDGKTVEVACRFSLRRNQVTFQFPDGFNPLYDLVIDPLLVFGSYSGSTADNWGYTATYDSDGNLYAGGSVFNNGYPTTLGAYQVSFSGGSCDIAISKYESSGAVMAYSTYLGGGGAEVPHSLIVNSQNELFVYGTTGSANFPMAGSSFDNSFNGGTAYTLTNIINFSSGSDIIIARFSANGQQLLSSTYVGGNGNDGLNMFTPLRNNYADDCRGEILIDKNDNIYVVSTTASTNFPVTGGVFQPAYAGGTLDGCVFKMDNSLSTMIWASYLGGSGIDAVYSISLDEDDSPIVAGGTTSTNFPVNVNAVKPVYQGGTCDGFITRINKNGDIILRSTYWGTPSYDQVYFVELDRDDNIYVLGQTRDATSLLHQSATWWTPGGGQFISKINPLLTVISWSTIFGTGGGTVNISPTAFLVDYCNTIYLSGWGSPTLNGFGGTSGMPLTGNAFQTTTDNNDYYFMAISDDASSLVYGSFYGGSSAEHVDGGTSRFDRMGKIYQSVCAGCGGWDDFPTTPGAWSNTNNSSNCNNGVIKIDFQLPVLVAEFIDDAPICLPGSVQFTNTSNIPNPGQTTCFWDFGDGTTSTDCNPSHTYSSSGVYTVMLAMHDLGSCNQDDTIYHQILVLSNSSDTLPDAHMCLGSFTQIGIPPYVGTGVTYQWNPTSSLSNSTISNPICNVGTTTNYTLMISDGVCTDTLRQRVNVYNIQANAGPDTTICFLNHTLTASSSGGGTGVQYHWSSNSQFTDWLNASPSNNQALVNVTGPSWYYVLAYNQWCSDVDSVFVDVIDITTGFTPVEPLCFDDCNGSLSVAATGGNAPYNYLWSNAGETTQTINGICAGIYLVTVSDQDGCQAVGQYELLQPTPLQIACVPIPVPCEVACNGTITASVLGGTGLYSYEWSNGQSSNPAIDLCQGNYSLTVTDENNCEIFIDTVVEVNYIYSSVDAWTDDDTLWEGQSTDIHATDISGVNYSWTPSSWLDNPDASTTMATPPPGTHWYYIQLDDGNGCLYYDSVKITVLDVFCYDPYLYLPNSFTPDGDGLNDILYARGVFIEEMDLLIFDRWGALIFETHDPDYGWDGTYKGKEVDPGVYAYYLKIKCYNQLLFIRKGNITLIR